MKLKNYNQDKVSQSTKIKILLVLPITLFLLAFLLDDLGNIITGIYKIIIHPSILLTDYLTIAGIGATFINSSILVLINIYIIYKLKVNINGPIIAAVLIISGFSFFGKNLFNVWPIYIGGFIYSMYHNIKFKNILLITMFGTGIAPIVSLISFGLNFDLHFGLLLGITFGIIIGFILPSVSSHMLKVHDGYNLYNIGFTVGLLGTVLIALFRSYGFKIETNKLLSYEYHNILLVILLLYSLFLIITAIILDKASLRNYFKIFNYSGRLISDFTHLVGFEITLLNMGLMGIVSIVYVIISKGTINGPILGGILTVIGFSAFGKHIKNTIPILFGVFLASSTKIWNITSTAVIIAGLFGTTLAPIAGVFGPIIGILAGFIHLSVVMNVGFLHGGINLYNNGFSGGIVASILIPIIDAFNKEDI